MDAGPFSTELMLISNLLLILFDVQPCTDFHESHTKMGVFMRTASSLGRRLYVYDRNENSTLGNLTRIFSRYGQVIDELGTIRGKDGDIIHEHGDPPLQPGAPPGRDNTIWDQVVASTTKENFTTMSVDWLLDILFFIRQHSTDMRRSTSPSRRNTAARALMTLATTDYDNGYETELLEAVAQATDDDL